MVGACFSCLAVLLQIFGLILGAGNGRTVVAQAIKARSCCDPSGLQDQSLEVVVPSKIGKVGKFSGKSSRFSGSSFCQAAADKEIQQSENAQCLEMPVLLGASGKGHLTHCKGCNRHWRQADYASNPRTASRKPKRSQSAKRHGRQETNSKDAENKKKSEGEEETVFTNKLPWVVSSPQPKAPSVEAAASQVQETPPTTESQMPSSPVIEEPDVNQVLQHLRALKQAWGSLPSEMEVRLQACEEKVKDRALTHGHLNKMGKLNKQLKGIATKLTAMDENWMSFSKKVQQKFEQHRDMYHKSRQELVQSYMEKAQELQMAKQEIQQASSQLSVETSLNQPPILTPTVTAGEALQGAIEQDAMMTLEEMDSMYPPSVQLEAMDGMDEIFRIHWKVKKFPNSRGEMRSSLSAVQ